MKTFRDTYQLREIFLSVELDLIFLLPSPPRKHSILLRLCTMATDRFQTEKDQTYPWPTTGSQAGLTPHTDH